MVRANYPFVSIVRSPTYSDVLAVLGEGAAVGGGGGSRRGPNVKRQLHRGASRNIQSISHRSNVAQWQRRHRKDVQA